jgi:glycosyltransferase involved in cell wall biosynthesis
VTANLVSVVIPVYNQADHIERIVHEFEGELAKFPGTWEMILVVNGSRDGSSEVCAQLARENPSIHSIDSDRGGWGHAVKLGLQAANGDLLCYTNSARTSAQDLLLMLLYEVAYPNVVVKANRKIRDSWRRRLGSLLYNLECRALFDLSQWDINGTPKIFPRSFSALLELTCDDDLIDAEFNAVCRRERYPMIEVPIFSTRRHGGSSTTNYRSALNMYWGAFHLWRTMQPGGATSTTIPARD